MALRPELEVPRLLAGGRRQVDRRLAELFVRTWDEEGTRNPILTLIWAAATQARAAELLSEFFRPSAPGSTRTRSACSPSAPN